MKTIFRFVWLMALVLSVTLLFMPQFGLRVTADRRSPDPNPTRKAAADGVQSADKKKKKKKALNLRVAPMRPDYTSQVNLSVAPTARPDYNSQQLYSDKWRGYRLGDMVLWPRERKQPRGREFHLEHFPNTIATDFLVSAAGRRRKGGPDWTMLTRILRRHTRHRPECNSASDAFVVHLRVGDVFDARTAGLIRNMRNKSYSSPIVVFENAIAEVNRSLIRNIKIVAGGTMLKKGEKKSMDYIEHVRRVFADSKPAFASVEVRVGGDPDCAFLMLSGAAHLCRAGGGFANLAANLVLKAGGKVYCSTAFNVREYV